MGWQTKDEGGSKKGIDTENKPEDKQLAGRILVAEDNEINREIISRLLGSIGFEVDMAVNGREAVNKFGDEPAGTYVAILMDVMMPIMDGYEATKRIRGLMHPDSEKIPIVALTASAFKEAEEKGYKAGMTDYLTKPIRVAVLKETLQKIIDEK